MLHRCSRYVAQNCYKLCLFSLALVSCAGAHAVADEYRAEAIAEAAPEEVAESIAGLLAPEGIKVVKGESRTVCEIWLCKEWEVQPGFEATAQVLYPFSPGQLVGVIRFKRKSADFRDQPISKGVYTLRYMHQPVDGNHVGTSPTRDFLLLVAGENDTDPKVIDYKTLVMQSAAAAESSHPAMYCLQKADNSKSPSVRHNEDHDWRILQVTGTAVADGKASKLPIAIVVEGIAAE